MRSTVLDGLGTWVRGSLQGKCGAECTRLACGGLNLCEACEVLGVLDLSCRGRREYCTINPTHVPVFNSYETDLIINNFCLYSFYTCLHVIQV